jgi:hypothetical protein
MVVQSAELSVTVTVTVTVSHGMRAPATASISVGLCSGRVVSSMAKRLAPRMLPLIASDI